MCYTRSLTIALRGYSCATVKCLPTSVDFGPAAATRFLTLGQEVNRPGGVGDLPITEEEIESDSDSDVSSVGSASYSDNSSLDSSQSSAHSSLVSDASAHVWGSEDSEDSHKVASRGEQTITVSNKSILTQQLRLVQVEPVCFHVPEEFHRIVLEPGTDMKVNVLFSPTDSDTVYVGNVVYEHAFGQLVIPSRGIGASARLEVTDPAIPKHRGRGVSSILMSRELANRPVLDFGQVLLHTPTVKTITITNGGMLDSRFLVQYVAGKVTGFRSSLSSTYTAPNPFRLLLDDSTEVTELEGLVENGDSVQIDVKCEVFESDLPGPFRGEIRVRWEVVPGGLWKQLVIG